MSLADVMCGDIVVIFGWRRMACRIDHDVKGTAVYVFVTLSSNAPSDREAVRRDLLQHVRSVIGAFAVPEVRSVSSPPPPSPPARSPRQTLRRHAEMHTPMSRRGGE